MKLTLDGKSYRVRFTHFIVGRKSDVGEIPAEHSGQTPARGLTTCDLKPWDAPKEEVGVRATARCSISDPFDKGKGRKLSLHRALMRILPRAERKRLEDEISSILGRAELAPDRLR